MENLSSLSTCQLFLRGKNLPLQFLDAYKYNHLFPSVVTSVTFLDASGRPSTRLAYFIFKPRNFNGNGCKPANNMLTSLTKLANNLHNTACNQIYPIILPSFLRIFLQTHLCSKERVGVQKLWELRNCPLSPNLLCLTGTQLVILYFLHYTA